MSNTNNRITIRQGYEYRTCFQNIYDSTEYFYPQYMQVAKCIDEITGEMWRYLAEVRKWDETDTPDELDVMGYPNNIIGLCARRGQGKSSTMFSVTAPLKDFSEIDEVQRKFWEKAYEKNESGSGERKKVYETKYCVIKSVDPTTMEWDESVLEIIVARLLRFANKQRKKYNGAHSSREKEEQYQRLLEKFQNVYRQVRRLKRSKNEGRHFDEYDDLTNIMEIADSRNVKRAFAEMVRDFLKYVQSDMLVIPVDDTDLNTERAYEIAEDIRKYCVVPQVMVLMAVHLGTLRTCIEQEFVRKYEKLLVTSLNTDHMEKYQCREMAERYIDKLIPGQHQVHLPYVDDRIRDGISNLTLQYISNQGKNIFDQYAWAPRNPKQAEEENNARQRYHNQLARMLFEKTGVVLIEKPGYLHNFMPRRFRELTHFLAFLSKLTDIGASGEYSLNKLIRYAYFDKPKRMKEEQGYKGEQKYEEYINRRIRNMDQLEMYFFQHWCPIVLTKNQLSKLEKIRTVPLSLKNKKTVEVLREYCKEHNEESIKEPTFPDTHQVVTYADVMDALAETKKTLSTHFKFDFVYAIQMYYTIYMNKILCQCLKDTSRCFTDLYLLTKGVLYNEGFIVKNDILNDALKGWMGENPNQQKLEIANWLIPCDKDGIVEDRVDGEWLPNITDNGIEEPTEFFRFDSQRLLLGIISSESIKAYKENYEENCEKHDPRSAKKLNDDINRMVDALYYIANFDLQYRAKKQGLFVLRNADNVNQQIIASYVSIRDVLSGKKNDKTYHYLPITEQNEVLYVLDNTTLFGWLNKDNDLIDKCREYCKFYKEWGKAKTEEKNECETNVRISGMTVIGHYDTESMFGMMVTAFDTKVQGAEFENNCKVLYDEVDKYVKSFDKKNAANTKVLKDEDLKPIPKPQTDAEKQSPKCEQCVLARDLGVAIKEAMIAAVQECKK